MKYYSLQNKSYQVSFREAVIAGLAPDKSLFFPENIPVFPPAFWQKIANRPLTEVAFDLIQPFVGDDIPAAALRNIVEETLNFPFPCVPVNDRIYSLELFHGPTLAFKDVGARFMSRCLRYFNQESNQKVTVLVATSGDTGGAVAHGFLGVEGVQVVILYPKGMVSDIQERQLTTLGQNISAIEVEGRFDDCQDMVKRAFLDADLTDLHLTSANSINVARWLPQMFYYIAVCQQLAVNNKELIISCPSGNFGNSCAGLLLQKMGAPIKLFVAATNINDTVPRFFEQGTYEPHTTQATLSNAMDVSNPSNFVRILELFNNDSTALKQKLRSFRFTDLETTDCMRKVYAESGYICEPHGAVGYLGLQAVLAEYPESIGVFLETAHPVKFLETVEQTLDIQLPLPSSIAELLPLTKVKTPISDYESLKKWLLAKL
ncbi:MAG: threonine synthase [Flavobacterium sp. BFFFF2]|nr:MAG: threonine synthase [Flavobacterium sp. BFFFF2]